MRRCRLIYKSIAYPEILEPEAIGELTTLASERNKESGITGILLLSGDSFLQALEGPVRFVNQLFIKIANDKRHHDIELVAYEDINATCFHDWSMRLVDLAQIQDEKRELLLQKYPHSGDAISYPNDKMLLFSLLMDAKNVLLAS